METLQLKPIRNNYIEPLVVTEDATMPRNFTMGRTIHLAEKTEKKLPFIQANTKEIQLQELQRDCIIPVFNKDNEMTISHTAFIETVLESAHKVFATERITSPEIRVSHTIKGRTPEAINKPVKELTKEDKTIYYERMMFCFEIPSFSKNIEGCNLSLTIGGVRAYNQTNLYSKKNAEKFKIFIGFKNLVCCNMCVSTDGFLSELKAMSTIDIYNNALQLFQQYNAEQQLNMLNSFRNTSITEQQFAQFLGKCKMYQFLPQKQKQVLPELLLTDSQIRMVAKSYFNDPNFGVNSNKELSIWNLYNLFTEANKTSYIDNFLDRALNATDVAKGIQNAIEHRGNYSWFIE